jgi:hypothetical protein
MALVIEVEGADGAVQQIPVTDAATIVTAAPGQSFRVLSDLPGELADAQIRRVGEDLIITDLPDGQTLTLQAFFQYVGTQQSPELHLASFGGASDETLTQSSEPIAALANGFLLWTGPSADDRQPVAPESEFNWRPFAAVGAGLVVVAGAGGSGGGGDAGVVGSDQTPATPIISTEQVTSTTPVIAGTGTPGSTVTILIDLGGSGRTVSYRTTVDTDGNWSVDTATATPFVGSMPADGLPTDAPSPVSAIANSPAGNSGLASGSLEVDETPPVATATLDAIESDAPAPVGDTELDIKPGRLDSGESTNDTSPTLTGTISAPLEPDDTVVILRNGQIAGQAEVTGLDWTFTDANVPAGEHVYIAQVSDPAGNLSQASASITINVDGSAPTVPTIDAIATDDVVTLAEAQAGVIISGAAEAGSTVTVQWGAAEQTTVADSNGVFSITFEASSLPGDGRTPVSVTATDSFGNVSESALRPVNVAAGLPAAPIIDIDSELLAGDVAAINASEAAGGFTVTGSAEPGTPVRVTFTPASGGQAFEATSTVNGSGEFAVVFANGAVPDGQYDVVATVTDFAGQSVDGPVVNILVDTVAPTATATVNGAVDDQPAVTGNLGNGAITNDATPTITGSISANLAPDESVLILRNGQPVGTADVNGQQWQFEEAALPEGQYAWTAVVVDAAGNTGPTGGAAFGLTLDLTAPLAPTINALTGDDVVTGGDAAGGVPVTGSGPAGGQVQLNWAGQIQFVNVDAQGNWATVFASPPADGRTQITATVTDAAGNEAEAFRTVQVDTAPPQTPGISVIAGNDVISGAEASQGVVIAGTGEAGTQVDVRWGDLTASTTVSNAGFWSVNFSNVPADGTYSVTASAIDVGGNRSANATRDVTVDTTAPTRPTIQVIEGDDVITATEVADGIVVQGNAQPGSSVTVTWAGEAATTQAAGDGAFRVVFTTVPVEGNSTIEVTSTDSAGNTSPVGTRAVQVNTTLPPQAPEVNALASGNVINAAEASNGIAVSGTAQAGSAIRVSWGGVVQTTTTAANGSWAVNYAANELPADGASSITVSASNAGGSSSLVTVPVTIDTTAPAAPVIAVVAGDDIVNAAESQNGVSISGSAQAGSQVTVTWEGVTEVAQTNNAGQWQVTFNAAPADGTSTINATATDSAGNTSVAGSRDVTVNTVTPPPAPQVQPVTADNAINAAEATQGPRFSGSSEAGAQITVTWEGATATTTASNSGAWSVTFAQGDIPADGATSISVIAENTGGPSAPTTHNFVLDTAAPATPVISPVAGDDIISATESGSPIAVNGTAEPLSEILVSWGTATTTVTTAANGTWSAVFNSLPVSTGESTIQAVATDPSGNTGAAATRNVEVITVQAPQAPSIDAVATDGTVNAAEATAGVTLSGTSAPGSQINLTWGSFTGSTVTAATGAWSIVVATAAVPADGNTVVAATASNAGGTSNPATTNVTVDTTAPAAPLVTAIAGDDVISVAEQSAPILVTGTAAANTQVTVTWGDLTDVVNTNAAGTWQASFATLPTGNEAELTATATDAAGNISAAATHTFSIQQAVAPSDPVISIVSNDDVVNVADASAGIVIAGTADAGAQIDVTWGNVTETATTNAAGNWSASFSSAQVPANGAAPVSAIATLNGLNSAQVTRPVTVDTEAPEQLVSIGDLVDNSGLIDVSIADGNTTTDLTPELTITLDSALDPTDTIVLSMDGNELLTLTAADDLTVQLDAVSVGEHTFEVQVFDEAENAGAISDPFTVLFEAAQNLNDFR